MSAFKSYGGVTVGIKMDTEGPAPASKELLDLALQQNVPFVHEEGFSSNDGDLHSARFSFSQPCIEDILFGIRTLGDMFWELEAGYSVKFASQ